MSRLGVTSTSLSHGFAVDKDRIRELHSLQIKRVYEPGVMRGGWNHSYKDEHKNSPREKKKKWKPWMNKQLQVLCSTSFTGVYRIPTRLLNGQLVLVYTTQTLHFEPSHKQTAVLNRSSVSVMVSLWTGSQASYRANRKICRSVRRRFSLSYTPLGCQGQDSWRPPNIRYISSNVS